MVLDINICTGPRAQGLPDSYLYSGQFWLGFRSISWKKWASSLQASRSSSVLLSFVCSTCSPPVELRESRKTSLTPFQILLPEDPRMVSPGYPLIRNELPAGGCMLLLHLLLVLLEILQEVFLSVFFLSEQATSCGTPLKLNFPWKHADRYDYRHCVCWLCEVLCCGPRVAQMLLE